MQSAKHLFEGTSDRYLGAAIGTITYIEQYDTNKISEFIGEVKILLAFALTQPHAAYSAFCHGLIGTWTYLARTIPHSSKLFIPIEDANLPSLVKAHSMTLIETCWHFQLGWEALV